MSAFSSTGGREPGGAERLMDELLKDMAQPAEAAARRARLVDGALAKITEVKRSEQAGSGASKGQRASGFLRRRLAVPLAAVAAALAMVFLATSTSGQASAAVTRLSKSASAAVDRTYRLTMERRGSAAPEGRFVLWLRGAGAYRLKGLAGPFEGLLLGSDGDAFFAVPPRPRAPALVTTDRQAFTRWTRGRELDMDGLTLHGVIESLQADFRLSIDSAGDGQGLQRLSAARPPHPTGPSTVNVDFRTSDDTVVRMEVFFEGTRGPRQPRRVLFELAEETPLDDDWFSVDRNVPAHRRRIEPPR